MLDPSKLSGLAALPWQFQIVLASGYCAYLMAFIGSRHTHKAADTVFGTLAFGLIAFAILAALPANVIWYAAGAAAFGGSLLAAILWRSLLRNWLRKAMRATGYSFADDSPRAWDRLLEGEYGGTTQLTVELDDGRKLLCTEAMRVGSKPYGPFVLGTSGDVLLYVDQVESPDGKVDDVLDVFNDDWGDLLTYVPAHRIVKVSIRII